MKTINEDEHCLPVKRMRKWLKKLFEVFRHGKKLLTYHSINLSTGIKGYSHSFIALNIYPNELSVFITIDRCFYIGIMFPYDIISIVSTVIKLQEKQQK